MAGRASKAALRSGAAVSDQGWASKNKGLHAAHQRCSLLGVQRGWG